MVIWLVLPGVAPPDVVLAGVVLAGVVLAGVVLAGVVLAGAVAVSAAGPAPTCRVGLTVGRQATAGRSGRTPGRLCSWVSGRVRDRPAQLPGCGPGGSRPRVRGRGGRVA